MFTVVITEKGGSQRRMGFDKGEVTIGRVQGNDVILPKGNVSKRHSRIVLKDSRFVVVDLKSTNGTYVNGRKITSPLVVRPTDKIYIGDFILTIEPGSDSVGETSDEAEAVRAGAQPVAQSAPAPRSAASRAEQPAAPHGSASAPALSMPAAPPPMPAVSPVFPAGLPTAGDSVFAAAFRSLMGYVAVNFDLYNIDPRSLQDENRWSQARAAVEGGVREMQASGALDASIDPEALHQAALREAVGFGALETLLSDQKVRELLVQSPRRIVADTGEGLKPVEGLFSSSEGLMLIARRLAAQAGVHLDPAQPFVEVTLPYGPHLSVLQPPVAVRGPVLEIRRMGQGTRAKDLIERGTLSEDMLTLLTRAVQNHRSVLVMGASGAGLTTLLSALVELVPGEERVVTVEEVADLHVQRDDVIPLAVGGAHSGATLREVLQHGARLRCDRLIVDDIRGPELFDALTALAGRSGGDMLGVQASAIDDPFATLRLLAGLSPRVGKGDLDELLGQAVHLVVRVARAGSERRVIGVSEVVKEKGAVTLKDLFRYDGGFESVGEASF